MKKQGKGVPGRDFRDTGEHEGESLGKWCDLALGSGRGAVEAFFRVSCTSKDRMVSTPGLS